MAFITEIKDDTGCTLARLAGVHDRYQFTDGSTMFIDTRAAWCPQCRAFVLVEKLTSADELEIRVREFAADREKTPLLPFDIISEAEQRKMYRDLLEKGLIEARQWRAALRNRLSPPRCLECAGTSFILLATDESWIVHPGDSRRMIHTDSGIIHAELSSVGRLYDTEGNVHP